MITVKEYSNDYRDAWEAFTARTTVSTIAHAIGFNSVIEQSLGHKPVYLIALQNNEIRGILPLFLVTTFWRAKYLISVPWLDYGGILAETNEVAEALFLEAVQLCKKHSAQFVEYRAPDPLDQNCVDRHDLKLRQDKVTFQLPLQEDIDSIWRGFDAKLRNQIRKAQKSELTTHFGSIEELPEFYRVFARKMHQLGTPVWGYKFFENILRETTLNAEIVLVKSDERVIAAGLVIKYGDTVYVPSAASISKFLPLCPNHALYWEIIKRSCVTGYKWFDFGRSTIDSNTYKFKKQWVKIPRQLHWQYYLNTLDELPGINPDNRKYRLFINIWKKLPLPMANFLGPIVIRNFP